MKIPRTAKEVKKVLDMIDLIYQSRQNDPGREGWVTAPKMEELVKIEKTDGRMEVLEGIWAVYLVMSSVDDKGMDQKAIKIRGQLGDWIFFLKQFSEKMEKDDWAKEKEVLWRIWEFDDRVKISSGKTWATWQLFAGSLENKEIDKLADAGITCLSFLGL